MGKASNFLMPSPVTGNVIFMQGNQEFAQRLVETLYIESMVLADDARAYFECDMRQDKPDLTPQQRVEISCESLKVTTRLMHSIAWLMNQKAYYAGELSEKQLRNHGRMLGHVKPGEAAVVSELPDRAQALIVASEDLYSRILRMEKKLQLGLWFEPEAEEKDQPRVRDFHAQLAETFGN